MTTSGKAEGGKTLFNQLLDFVTPCQEMRAVNTQLVGQMFGRHALSDAAQDQHDLNAGVTAATPDRIREQVEHCPTRSTAIIHNWSPMPVVGLLIGWQHMPARTPQSIGVQHLEQIVIALLLIHQLVNREDQHRSPRSAISVVFPLLTRSTLVVKIAPRRLHEPTFLVELLRVWYTDDNAIVREKADQVIVERRAPMLNAIVRQGIRDGVFTTPHPKQAGEIILYLLQGMGNTHARLLLSLEGEIDEQRCVEEIVAVHCAYMHAIERVLGAPQNSLHRADAEVAQAWVAALREN